MNEAQELFERLKKEGLKLLQEMLEQEQAESLWLDFKLVSGNKGPLKTEDKQNLGTALSGFANADGGVIVWGGDCRTSGKNQPDVLVGLPGLSNLTATLNQMRNLTQTYLAPGMSGIEHIPIDDGNDEDHGFICTYAPRWDGAEPQMAMGPDQHVYYCRSNARFVAMEHYQVSQFFNRTSKPKLELGWHIDYLATGGNRIDSFRLILNMVNTGPVTAHFPAISLARPEPKPAGVAAVQPFVQGGQTVPMGREGWWQTFTSECRIYPGFRSMAAAYDFQYDRGMTIESEVHLVCDGFSEEVRLSISFDQIEREIAAFRERTENMNRTR